jgi:hypothetical protein
MIKRIIYSLLLIAVGRTANAQQSDIDTFQKQLSITQDDTIKLVLLPEYCENLF